MTTATTERPTPTETKRETRGTCPRCGKALIKNLAYTGGRGYDLAWFCEGGLNERPTCDYVRQF